MNPPDKAVPLTLIVLMTFSWTNGRTLETEANHVLNPVLPVSAQVYEGETFVTGGRLVASVQLKFLNEICSQVLVNIKINVRTFRLLLTPSTVAGFRSDVGFIRRFSFLVLKVETAYTEILKFINVNGMCKREIVSRINEQNKKLKVTFDRVWDRLATLNATGVTTTVTQAFLKERPQTSLLPPGAQVFLGVAIAGLAGLIGGSLLGSVFGDGNEEHIEALNKNMHSINKKVLFTNSRIDVLSDNLTTSIRDIQIILDNIQTLNYEAESKYTILWNVEQLTQAATNLLILFKVADNSISLLRSGMINADLLNLETIKHVIAEGTKFYENLEFPIREVTSEHITEITSLVEIKHLGGNEFVFTIPLVHKKPYTAYALTPQPIRLKGGKLMVAEINDVVLINEQNYIITSSQEIHSLSNRVHILQTNNPRYQLNVPSCEYECIRGRLESMLALCTFKPVSETGGMVLTETEKSRLVYFIEETQIEIACPDSKIRDTLKGLHSIPSECDLTSNLLHWPARQSTNIDIRQMLTESKKGTTFDISTLPAFILNETYNLHDTIKTAIRELETEEPFTLNFDNEKFSLETVQTYAIFTQGAIGILVVINTILIAIVYANKIKQGLKERRGHKKQDYEEKNYNHRSKRRTLFNPRDSLKLSPRDSFRRVRKHLNHLSRHSLDSVRSSASSAYRNSRRKIQKKIKRTRSTSPTHPETNMTLANLQPEGARNIYPSLQDQPSKINNTANKITFKAYP